MITFQRRFGGHDGNTEWEYQTAIPGLAEFLYNFITSRGAVLGEIDNEFGVVAQHAFTNLPFESMRALRITLCTAVNDWHPKTGPISASFDLPQGVSARDAGFLAGAWCAMDEALFEEVFAALEQERTLNSLLVSLWGEDTTYKIEPIEDPMSTFTCRALVLKSDGSGDWWLKVDMDAKSETHAKQRLINGLKGMLAEKEQKP